MLRTFTCPCNDGFHKVDTSFPIWSYVVRTIDDLGEMIEVKHIETGKTYSVNRIFISIHGLRAIDLPKLGFKEV